MRKVLIANRGEIAVRVIRATRDAGLASVAVYADPDRDALHVRMADEAFALGGNTPGESYLVIEKVIEAASQSGADAVHPGYGFLSENADFAQAVLDAGLTWIGPSPQSIRDLGDKVTARHIALRAGAPLVPGTKDPVAGPDEVLAFAEEHGLPVAIKAAFGGGGRGLKIARTMEEIPELYASAVREAVSAFGRGECFVERYLDRSRHVEAQVLADTHGNVIVVGTRDCSLQRRNQKLVEEAPAPFLTDEQRERDPHLGQGDLPRGRLPRRRHGRVPGRQRRHHQLPRGEHPAAGRAPGHRGDHRARPGPRAVPDRRRRAAADHRGPGAARARLRVPDQRRGPGTRLPAGARARSPPTASRPGPGVRVDSGIEGNSAIGGAFDSLLAKLIVWGETRDEALARARRALDEYRGGRDGHRAAVPPGGGPRSGLRTADGQPFTVFTRWIETEFDNQIPPFTGAEPPANRPPIARRLVVEVNGRRLEVSLPAGFAVGGGGGAAKKAAPKRSAARRSGAAASGDALTAPMQGTIVKVAVNDGDQVAAGDLIVVLEAMKMEQPINAHKAGTVTGLQAETGAVVASGAVICELKD